MTRKLKRYLAALGIWLIVAFVVAGVIACERLGGWHGTRHWARVAYLAYVVPLTWPDEPFTSEAWVDTPVEQRYRLVKSLLDGEHLNGRTPGEVADLLGGSIPPETRQWTYELRRADHQNLWWVLVIEFEDGRVTTARRDMAWLDP